MTGQSLIRGSFGLTAPDDTGDPSAVDLRRLARLRQQAPRGIEGLLNPPASAALLTSRNGDLALWAAHDQWQAPYVPPLQGHLLAITLAPTPGCCSWLPGEGLQRRHLGGGEVLILPAGETGFVQWPARHQLLLLSLRPRLFYGAQALRRQATGAPVAARSGLVDPVIHGMATTLQAAGQRDVAAAGRMADHLARALAAHLVAHYAPEEAPQQSGLTQARLHRVLAFLESRLAEPVSLADAARGWPAAASTTSRTCSSRRWASRRCATCSTAAHAACAANWCRPRSWAWARSGCRVGLPDPARFSQMPSVPTGIRPFGPSQASLKRRALFFGMAFHYVFPAVFSNHGETAASTIKRGTEHGTRLSPGRPQSRHTHTQETAMTPNIAAGPPAR